MDHIERPEVVEGALDIGLARFVGDEDETGVVSDAFLLQGADAHGMTFEGLGHGAEHTGLIHHIEVDVVAREEIVDRADWATGERQEIGVRALAEVHRRINKVAEDAEITKVKAVEAVEVVFEAMKAAMRRGERIELRGFGVFQVKPRKKGIGRNPRTGREVRIPPGKTIRFKPGKNLRNLR